MSRQLLNISAPVWETYASTWKPARLRSAYVPDRDHYLLSWCWAPLTRAWLCLLYTLPPPSHWASSSPDWAVPKLVSLVTGMMLQCFMSWQAPNRRGDSQEVPVFDCDPLGWFQVLLWLAAGGSFFIITVPWQHSSSLHGAVMGLDKARADLCTLHVLTLRGVTDQQKCILHTQSLASSIRAYSTMACGR